MNRKEKKELVEELKSKIENSNFILTGFKGLTVAELEGLRNKLRKQNMSANVIKNRLLSIALKELNITGFDDYLNDITFLTIQNEKKSLQGLKVISEFSKENEKFFIKAGFIEGKALNAQDVVKIATLPSKEVLVARLLAQMNVPISKFVYVLNNPITKLAYALNAIKEKKTMN